MVGTSPFPVMQRAYEGRPLTEVEINALVGFLERADAEQGVASTSRLRHQAVRFWGRLGRRAYWVCTPCFGEKRKRGSVNQAIFDRQVKSI